MARKLRVGILFGGCSGEHEVSLLSAASILNAIDRKKFDVTPIGITKEGRWLAAGDARGMLAGDSPGPAKPDSTATDAAQPPSHTEHASPKSAEKRAGDPEATHGAKPLHEGIPTLLAPEPAAGLAQFDPRSPREHSLNSGSRAGGEPSLDVVFPVLHGTFGEDGTIQGLFELA